MSAHAMPKRQLLTLFRKPKPQAAKVPATPDPWSETAAADLVRFLFQELGRVGKLRASHWIMSPDWWQDLTTLRLADGELLLQYDLKTRPQAFLFGIPVEVHPWSGVPALVPLKASNLTPAQARI